MGKKAIIYVDLDVKCKRCGEDGATQSGLCMKCIAQAVKNGEFDHIINKHKPKLNRQMEFKY